MVKHTMELLEAYPTQAVQDCSSHPASHAHSYLVCPFSSLLVPPFCSFVSVHASSGVSSINSLPAGGKCDNSNTPMPTTATACTKISPPDIQNNLSRPGERTALQKNVMYALPTPARLANTNPNRPCVASLATFSTRVTALSASVRCDSGHISVMTPLAAGAEPDPKGRRNAAGGLSAIPTTDRQQGRGGWEHT